MWGFKMADIKTMNREDQNKNWLPRLVVFTILFCSILIALDRAFFAADSLNDGWEYVRYKEEPIDVLIVGNSHAYRSFDTELISEALDINCRMLATASANGTIMEASLQAFLQYQVPRIVVLEAYAFFTDNYETMRSTKKGLVMQHLDGIPDPFLRCRAAAQTLCPEDIPAGVSQLFRTTNTWSRWEEHKPNMNAAFYGYLPSRKFKTIPGYDAKENARFYFDRRTEGYEKALSPQNAEALERIHALSEKYGFEIWVVLAPTAVESSKDIYAGGFNAVQKKVQDWPQLTYISNFHELAAELELSTYDYYDAGHLNRSGAEKLSAYMISLMEEQFSLKADYTDIISYRGESVEPLNDGRYRYTMMSYGDALYRFTYRTKQGETVTTEFSPQNWIEIAEPDAETAVKVEMISAGTDLTKEIKKPATYVFMEESKD